MPWPVKPAMSSHSASELTRLAMALSLALFSLQYAARHTHNKKREELDRLKSKYGNEWNEEDDT